MFEVSDVEYRNNEFYVRVMTNTVDGTKTAGLAKRVFVGGSLGRRLMGGNAARNMESTRRLSRTPSLTGRRSAAV
jgi:hypothetical protein